jgi:c(7)-type cytochrome triheme protein
MNMRMTFKPWKVVFGVIMALGAYATVIRFTQGLGATTNLSNEFPWGLWIGFDILVGVGLAAGGFVVAATVHLFQIEKYEPVARPAILTAFLGYLLVIVALMFDLGRPYRIWHPLVMGNPHSVMFEVAMCVMLYTVVLACEFSPIVFARFKMEKALKVVRTVYIPLVILGVLLSTLHQSSLGTMYVIVPDKLHGLWYTPLLPVFFFLSAVSVGLAMTIFESFMSARAFGKRLESELLEGMARVAVVTLALLLLMRFMDLHSRGNLHLAFTGSPESVMFWGEVMLGVALPMVLFAMNRVRRSEEGLFFGALLTVMGFIINRLNVAITGMAGSSGVNYVPTWMEFAVTTSIVAAGFLLFYLAVKHLNVFPDDEVAQALRGVPVAERPRFRGRPIAAMWGLLAVGVVLFGFTSNWQNRGPEASTVDVPTFRASGPVTLPEELALPVSEDSPGPVTFDHSTHVDTSAPNCGACHAGLFKITSEGIATRTFVGHGSDDGTRCDTCHNGDDAFDWEEDCEMCHVE